MGVGGKNMTIIVDTYSDLTCYSQQDPLFDPSASPSPTTTPYSLLQVATGKKVGVHDANWSTCNCALSYGDGSYTGSMLGRERIDIGGTSIKGFIFGCDLRNHDLFDETSDLMALSRTQLPLSSQATSQFSEIFSYYLRTRILSSSGSLVLGNDPALYRNSAPVSYTRMVLDPQQAPFYFLNLTGTSVDEVALDVTTEPSLIRVGLSLGLHHQIYQALKVEFMKQFSRY